MGKTKSENVIQGLKCCNPNEYHCDICPYDDGYESCARCKPALHSDAIALLKAQEPVGPKLGGNAGPFGTQWYQCSACSGKIDPNDKYCRHCGRVLKWE